jgi:hypothetical protein
MEHTMTLSERLSEYVRAAFSGIWVQRHQHDDARVARARDRLIKLLAQASAQ